MELTEKWLGEIGGWAAMKAARGLVDAGLVTVQTAEPGLLRGLSGGGKMKFAAGLKIRSRTDVDNLCTCSASRRGMICEHSLSVALAWLRGKTGGGTAIPGKGAPAPLAARQSGGRDVAKTSSQLAQYSSKANNLDDVITRGTELKKNPLLRVNGRYVVYLPEGLLTGNLREPVAVYVKFEPGGKAEESRLAAWLAEQGVKGQSVPLSLPAADWPEFLSSLSGHPRVFLGKPSGNAIQVQVADEPVSMPVVIESAGQGDVTITQEGSEQLPVSRTGGWWLCRETSTLFSLPPAFPEVEKLLVELAATALQQSKGGIRRSLAWLVAQRNSLADVFQVEMRGTALENFHVAPVPCDFELFLDGSFQVLDVTVTANFQKSRWAVPAMPGATLANNVFPIQDQEKEGTFYVRNQASEARLMALFSSLGFKPSGKKLGPDGELDVLRLSGAETIMKFYASDLPRLQKQVKVIQGERWRAVTRGVARIVPQVRREPGAEDTGSGSSRALGGDDWMAMEFGYVAPDGFRLARSEVLRLMRSGQRTVQGKNGKKYLLDLGAVEEFEDVLRDVPLQLTAEGAKMNALHAPYFFPEDEAYLPKLPDADETLARLGELGSKLRPYQLLGVRWMQSLVESGRGGVLGDEMGLGKTVQSIAAVTALLARTQNAEKLPVLVVCPKSLVGNWRAEFERFAPQLKVAAVHGSARGNLLKDISVFDVIITTYHLIVRDIKIHQKQIWSLILLDEASYIRNPDTDAAKALRSLKGHARIALTGTPVENSAGDLWSIYQFLLPGYLGSKETFKERFEQPIHGHLDTPAGQAASERLKKLVRPYFLRRTKREVLRDLPEKIEQVLWCEPTPVQAEVYRRLLEEGREEIKLAKRRSGQAGAKMTMFTVLLRLRQACCDLRLTGLSGDALKGLEKDDLSGKWPLMQERLEAILQEGGKVLIFSQFVQYLRLVREQLDQAKVAYNYLDGSSNDREEQVRSFQTDPDKKVFLISLKAGGYGLNLTAADHVMLLDPWWNPAVEAQAIDRAHRIGQQRVVTAYRLAVRGTVEERILALQARKRGLIEATLDEQSPLMTGLQIDDLESLIGD